MYNVSVAYAKESSMQIVLKAVVGLAVLMLATAAHADVIKGQVVTADGRPLVTADSEHFNARLEGTTVRSSGEVRDSTVHVDRVYNFADDGIECEVRLRETDAHELLNLWVRNPFRGQVARAYEMIPYVGRKLGAAGKGPAGATDVTAVDEGGKPLGPLTESPLTAKTIVIDRGGFGVRVELESPHRVLLGQSSTVLIQLVEGTTPAREISLKYRLIPFRQ